VSLPAAWIETERAFALPLAVALPLVAAIALLALRRWPNLREGATLAGGLALAALVALLWPLAQAGLTFELWTWLPGLSLRLSLEPLGLLFAAVAGFLWPVTALYSIGYMRANGEARQTRFYFFFAVAIAAAIGIALAGNALTLFLFYELLTLSTWPLVGHKGTPEARRGARVYLLVLLATSIGLLLPALVWTHALAGTTDFRAGGILAGRAGDGVVITLFALYLFGTGKAALMPFHRWLPSAMVAPTPVSALLHAVAVVKAGVFTVLKVAVYIFGLDTLRLSGAGELMAWVAAFTLLAASVVALTRDNLKARLAYSTVSQLAYIVLAATVATGTAVAGGALHIATHAVAKITLFFCAGAIYTAAHKTEVSELDGLGRAMPFTFAAFFVASLSIVGLPPLGGAWSKWLLISGAAGAGETALMVVLLASSLLSLAYLLPVPIRAFLRPAPGGNGPIARAEAPWACVVPLCATAAACVALFFFAEALLAPVARMLEGRP
jgi:multicomponent Na+:H+ antiporter subunit D